MRTLLLVVLCGSFASAGEPKVLVGWEFEKEADLKAWQWNEHVADVKVADGCLVARVVNWDPLFISPVFELPARHSQWIEVKIRATESGQAEFFWSNTLQGQYGGFSPGKETPFQLVGDGKWHSYVVQPYWEPEKKIVHLRLDLPGGKGRYEVDYVRIQELPPAPPAPVPVWEFEQDTGGWRFGDPWLWDGPGGVLGWLVPMFSANRASVYVGHVVSPPLDFPARERPFVVLRARTRSFTAAALRFATDTDSGLHRHPFTLRADGQFHVYLLDLSSDPRWRGTIRLIGFERINAPEYGTIDGTNDIEYDFIRVLPRPAGTPELAASGFGLADGLPRAGQRLGLSAVVANQGAGVARNVQATVELPPGLATEEPPTQKLGDLWYGETRILEWPVQAKSATTGTAKLSVSAEGLPPLKAEARLEIGPSLGLPKAPYVPEPKPAKTDYQVGAYYFPGWQGWASWRPIADYPERKPILGWYDESKPEIADWQIKWAVEHGISFFAVDWYWCQGARQLEHWLHDAYLKSRYRRFLKFCLLWANHNPPNTSSEADLLAVTDFWVQNYFKLPEYLKVEGKPLVIIFSPHRFTDDMGSAAVAAAFQKMRERCRKAGLGGLYLIACAGSDRGSIERLKAEGYDAISGYNYPSLGSNDRHWFPYADNIAGYKELWNAAANHRLLKEIPVLSGGWDSRPWHGQRALVVGGRTPALFERHCRDAKAFLDRPSSPLPPGEGRVRDAGAGAAPNPGVPHPLPLPKGEGARSPLPKGEGEEGAPRASLKMCLIEAWNEWGEGSYIEPHREYGFEYLESVRRVFAPDSPRPLPITPRDIGLGPYDYPRPKDTAPPKTAWDLSKPDDRGDWRPAAQVSLDPNAPLLKGTATGNDPILQGPVVRIPAESFPALTIEWRATQPDTVQLFWSTTTAGVCENNSIRFQCPGDGQFHTHRIRLADTPYWTGLVTGFRLDPATKPGNSFEIRSIRFAGSP
jgi:hypothetical protein